MNTAWLVGFVVYVMGPLFPHAGFLNRNHETVVCKAKSCCFCRPPVPRPKEGYSYWPQMHFQMEHMQQWFATRKRNAVLHIGPNDGDWGEAAFYSLLMNMAKESDVPLRLHFVEPLPSAVTTLRRRLYRFLGPNQSVKVVNAAVCPKRQGERQVPASPYLHSLSQTVPANATANVATFIARAGHLSSLNYKKFYDEIFRYARMCEKQKKTFTAADLRAIWDLLKWHIVSIPVKCPSVPALLEDLQLDISQVGLLIIDAEGLDTMLLEDFLSLPGFKPAVLQWEYQHHELYPSRAAHRNATIQVVKQMAALGYDIQALKGDLVAVEV